MITLTAQLTMRAGKERLALARIAAVKEQADREQPGTLLYLVHRVLNEKGRPTAGVLFYECYADKPALDAHLASSSWKTLTARWAECFEGTPKVGDGIAMTSLKRIAGFVHLQAP